MPRRPILSSLTAVILFFLTASHGLGKEAAPYYWVDSDGFHAVESLAKVPLAHRRDLPMARNRTSLPFGEEEDADGSMYVWFILGQAGFDYPYVKGEDIPRSPLFTRVEKGGEGDVAWWAGHVAIATAKGTLLTAHGELPLAAEEKKLGKALWYRYSGPVQARTPPAGKRAPKKTLKEADTLLAELAGAAFSPPRVKDKPDLERLRSLWRRAVKAMEAQRSGFPDDPRVLRRLGECYRMGHNLDLDDTWERAEAFLLRSQALDPDDPETAISLGALYADTDFENGAVAEAQFRLALPHARKDQLPQVWWGIAVSLYYQGKIDAAVKAIDRVIALRPGDGAPKRLRETFLEAQKKK
jgi:hypothetical protein